MDKDITLQASWSVLVYVVLGIIGVGCLSGSYPAFYLSAVNPLIAFKGGQKNGKKGGLIRGSWAGTSQGFLRKYGSCSRVNDGTGGTVLINLEIFDNYMEQFRQPARPLKEPLYGQEEGELNE